MKWERFKEMIKELRNASDTYSRIYKDVSRRVTCDFQIHLNNESYPLNPFCCNLKTGKYYGDTIICDITGTKKKVPNLKNSME